MRVVLRNGGAVRRAQSPSRAAIARADATQSCAHLCVRQQVLLIYGL